MCVVLVGCPVSAEPACPDATIARGARPPEGTKTWCEDGQGRMQGPVVTYFSGGDVETHGSARDDQLHGPFSRFHPSGALAERGEFVAGQRHGAWTTHDEAGRVTATEHWDAGRRVDPAP